MTAAHETGERRVTMSVPTRGTTAATGPAAGGEVRSAHAAGTFDLSSRRRRGRSPAIGRGWALALLLASTACRPQSQTELDPVHPDDNRPEPSAGSSAPPAGGAGNLSIVPVAGAEAGGASGASGAAGPSGARVVAPEDDAGIDTPEADGGGPVVTCQSDRDCENQAFCAGVWSCRLDTATAVRSCVRTGDRCRAGEACDEVKRSCTCDDPDADRDGHRDRRCGDTATALADDCDDADPNRFPGNPEVCDAAAHDEDCDLTTPGVLDTDGDGSTSARCCNSDPRTGDLDCAEDCDDTRRDVHDKTTEVCDGIDNNCNGMIDESAEREPEGSRWTFYADRDGDHYGDDAAATTAFCRKPPDGWVLEKGDCNDDERDINPFASEVCNGIDDDCDSLTDASDNNLQEKPDLTGTELECSEALQRWVITECPPVTASCDDDVYNGCERATDRLSSCRACATSCKFACGQDGCDEVTQISLGQHHSCVVTREGAVSCWGWNEDGRLGNDDLQSAAVPARTRLPAKAFAVAAGRQHSCAILGDDRSLYCWGSDAQGQLGVISVETFTRVPLAVQGPAGFLKGVTQIGAGEQHTCAIHQQGELSCWGLGSRGRLGNASTTVSSLVPAPVRRGYPYTFVKDAKQVTLGGMHSCLINQADRVECWGDNTLGQVGIGGGALAIESAREVEDFGAVQALAAGTAHTCALAAGRVYCWGYNSRGQVGQPLDVSSIAAPARVEGLEGIVAIAAGSEFTCALRDSGELSCWGSNYYGERGDSRLMEDTFEPSPIPGKRFSAIAAGALHACGLTLDRQLECWGQHARCQLGIGLPCENPGPGFKPIQPLEGSRP